MIVKNLLNIKDYDNILFYSPYLNVSTLVFVLKIIEKCSRGQINLTNNLTLRHVGEH